MKKEKTKNKDQTNIIRKKTSNSVKNKVQDSSVISNKTKASDSRKEQSISNKISSVKLASQLSNKVNYKKTHNIDAKDKVLGRFATEIAILLQGKNNPDYAPYKDPNVVVIVKNIADINVTGKKYSDKIYYKHSGYMGGLKETPYKKIFEKDPQKVLRLAVMGMLPKNRLRDRFIKRLKFN